MKQLNNSGICRYLKLNISLAFLPVFFCIPVYAQDSTQAPVILGISYFLPANHVPYLQVSTRKKVGRKFEPVENIKINVYCNDQSAADLLGTVTTAENGIARLGFPSSFKNTWDSLNQFKFIAAGDSSSGHGDLNADITIKKAILVVDTTSQDGTRMVTGELKEKDGNDWKAIGSIDMKLSVKRMDGNLSVGDKDTYTSDSTGLSSAEFKRDSIPGDAKGAIILAAEVDDNDTYGNLIAEKTVNWGRAFAPPTNFFDQRALWSTRFRTPVWLLVIAYSIVIGVWGTIFYIIFQLVKIKRTGTLQKG
ncbi:MAG TPA: hypothetical protein VG847_05045 [Chitinophagaceae bacterium]|nr:hypothetical protein [Chitinophagaceae bacterium]